MKNIIEFCNHFFEIERLTIDELGKLNLTGYNESLKKMNDFLALELINSFNMIFLEKFDDEIIEFYKENPPQEAISRYLYKVNKYQNDSYGEMYGAYVSGANPWMKEMNEILVITKLEKQLKIVVRLLYGVDEFGKQRWIFLEHDGGLKLTDFKNPLEVLKIMPPEDIDGIELYKKDDL